MAFSAYLYGPPLAGIKFQYNIYIYIYILLLVFLRLLNGTEEDASHRCRWLLQFSPPPPSVSASFVHPFVPLTELALWGSRGLKG